MRRGWLILPLAVLALAFSSCGDSHGVDGNHDVPTSRGNAARTGVEPGPGIVGTPQVLWKAQILGDVLVVDGTVYGPAPRVSAVDGKTGEERWTAKVGGQTMTIADGSIYVPTGDSLVVLDAQTGEERWRFDRADCCAGSPIVAGSVVYVGGKDGKVRAIDTSAREQRWQAEVESEPGEIAMSDSVVYVAGGRSLRALDARTGEEHWHFDNPGAYDAVFMPFVAVAEGTVLAVSMPDDTFYAIDARSGQVRWNNSRYLVLSQPAVARAIAYFPDNDQLVALDVDTGKVRWTFDVVGGSSSPVIVGDTVYLGAKSLYALDASTGEELWHFNPEPGGDSAVLGTPTIADGTAYVGFCLRFEGEGCNEYSLYAITGSEDR